MTAIRGESMTVRKDEPASPASMPRLRIDKWLWAARFFKTRTLAAQSVDLGRVRANGDRVKPAHSLRIGEIIEIQQGETRIEVVVVALSTTRGPAPQAQLLYAETPASAARRQAREQARRDAPEPTRQLKGRPTKRDRRELRRLSDV
jgi:ribosome-associated heat shock protein Hsp15